MSVKPGQAHYLSSGFSVFAVEVLVDEQSRNELIDDLVEGYNQAVIVWAAGETGATIHTSP